MIYDSIGGLHKFFRLFFTNDKKFHFQKYFFFFLLIANNSYAIFFSKVLVFFRYIFQICLYVFVISEV